MGALHAVLDVGNCTPDHTAIHAMLTSHFDVRIERVMHVSEALTALARQPFALVLVNRQIFADGSPGMPLIEHMHSDPNLKETPVMLVSNYADAQAAAVTAGARPGFGKASLNTTETIRKLAEFLPPARSGADVSAAKA